MARVTLSLLGQFVLTHDGRQVSGFRSAKVRALLTYLALNVDRPQSREALAGLLWPDQPDEAARTYLRQALANLREVLVDETTSPPLLLISRDTVQFDPACPLDVDVTTFRQLLAACARHPHRRAASCTACARRLEQAVAIYRGSFLDQFYLRDSAPFEEWAALTREALHQEAVTALAQLATYHERRGAYDAVEPLVRRQLTLDPWREEAHQQLMRALALSGQRSAALEQYERCRRVLASELDVEPAAETTALYERIRDTASAELSAQKVEPRRLQNFPTQTTALIGRESELAELGALLENPDCRLISVVGPGGIGKTRLALAAASEWTETFTHGAAFVPLAAISSAAFVAPAILAALGVDLQGHRESRDQLLEYLHGKDLLLVLDNVEHLLAPHPSKQEDCSELLTTILQRASHVTLLVTSRERLALDGEWLYDLPGLSFPTGETSGGIETYGAVQLFVQRASQMQRRINLADGEAHAVARICRLVEGLPLAIELAAAALRGGSVTAIAAAIESSMMTLASGLRIIPEQHRSMWATFEHSWRLLSDEERLVFPRLSVFRGGFDADAAAQVAQASPELLASLVNKSLLRCDGTARYDLHELVRQYAGEKLAAAGEAEAVRRRHAEYYLALTEHAERDLWAQSQFASWLARLSADHDNLRAALAWSQAGAGDHVLSLRLVGALNFFWMYRNHGHEAYEWIEPLLAAEPAHAATRREVPLRVRAKALRTAGTLAAPSEAPAFLEESTRLFLDVGEAGDAALSQWFLAHQYLNRGAHERALQLCEESQQGFRAAGNMTGLDWCLMLLSNIVREQGDLQRALILAEHAHTLAQELQLPMSAAYALFSLSRVRLALEDIEAARSAAEEALALGQQLGMPGLIPQLLLQLGRIVQAKGDSRQAAALWEQALAQARDVQHHRALGEVLLELGWLEHRRGNEERALALLLESLRLHRDRGDRMLIAESLAGIAGVYLAKACTAVDMFRVVRLYAAAQSVNVANPAILRHRERIDHAHDLATIRSKLDGQSFAAAWAEGEAMTLEQAIAYALEETQ